MDEQKLDNKAQWRKVRHKIEKDPRYKAVESSSQKEEWFKEHIEQIYKVICQLPLAWNSVPISLKQAPSLSTFKYALSIKNIKNLASYHKFATCLLNTDYQIGHLLCKLIFSDKIFLFCPCNCNNCNLEHCRLQSVKSEYLVRVDTNLKQNLPPLQPAERECR